MTDENNQGGPPAPKAAQPKPKTRTPMPTNAFMLEEDGYVEKLWEDLKKAYASAIVSTKSASEMRRVNETVRSKCYSILQLCKAEGGTATQAEIRQFVQRSFR